MSALLLMLLLAQTPRDATAQRAESAGATIGGVVRTSDGSATRPLRRAIVSIAGTSIIGVRQTVTDDSGRFLFDRLTPGRFTLTVDKPGYLRTYYGSRQPGRPPAMPVPVIDGQRLQDVAIDVPKSGVIEGSVRDDSGAPIAGSQVIVRQTYFSMGERRFSGGPWSWVVTDDRGHYRVWGLPPGEYIVGASGVPGAPAITTDEEIRAVERQLQTGQAPPPGSRVAGTQRQRGTVYFPGASDVSLAQPITLGLSEERTGVDITNAPVPSYNIEFIAVGPGGRPMSSAAIGMASLSRQSLFTSLGGVLPDAAGKGTVRGVPPGRYLFFGKGTETEDPAAPTLFTEAEVDLNGADASGVLLQFLPGQRVSGKLQAASGSLPVFGAGARVQLNPAPAIQGASILTPTAAVNADGSFAFVNVPPGRYRIELGVSGWSQVSALYQGVDTLDMPLDVRPSIDIDGLVVSATNTLTEIAGLVTDAAGRPAPELTVLVFSQERALWSSPRRFSGAIRIGSDGHYRVAGLPPGAYYLAVVTVIEPQQTTDPVFLEQLMTGAIPIRLTDGQKVVQDLKVGG
jgi:protocatechuate 3,4-dioxygenase beta subunit